MPVSRTRTRSTRRVVRKSARRSARRVARRSARRVARKPVHGSKSKRPVRGGWGAVWYVSRGARRVMDATTAAMTKAEALFFTSVGDVYHPDSADRFVSPADDVDVNIAADSPLMHGVKMLRKHVVGPAETVWDAQTVVHGVPVQVTWSGPNTVEIIQ